MKVKKIKKGSMTVETACVMSLILLVLMGTLDLCFFVHNRAWLTAAAYEAALVGSMEGVKEEGKVYEAAKTRCEELGNVGFFGAENLTANVEADDRVQVSYELDTIVGYGGLKWHLKTEGNAKIIRPAQWIRKVKAAGEVIKGIGEG